MVYTLFLKFQIYVLKKLLGRSHPSVKTCLYNLYEASFELGNLEEAEKTLRLLLEIEETCSSPNPKEIANFLAKLGQLILSPDRARSSQELLERAFQLVENEPECNKLSYEILENLAKAHRFLREDNKAESFQRRALKLKESELGLEHAEVHNSLTLLGKLLCDLGKYEEAEKHFQIVLGNKEKLFGKDHLELVEPLDNLANLLDQKGEFSRAELIYQRIVEIEKKKKGYIGHTDLKIQGHRPPDIENTPNPGETYSR